MQRSPLQTVTLPVLVACEYGEEDGLGAGPIREITDKMICDAVRKRTQPTPLGVRLQDWQIITALKLWLHAQANNDLRAARQGAEKLVGTPIVRIERDPSKQEQSERCPPVIMQFARETTPQEAKEAAIRRLTKDTLAGGGALTRVMTSLLEGAHPGLWQPGKHTSSGWQVGPPERGMLCDDLRAAVAYKLLFNGIQICLKCHSLFEGKANQNYDTIQCREAHRVARWREKKKAEAERKRSRKR